MKRLKRHELSGLLSLLLLLPVAGWAQNQEPVHGPDEATTLLLKRVLPVDRVEEFVVGKIASTGGRDVFELESKDGKLVVRGNNAVAVASGIHWFLKHKCNSQVSMNYRQISLPRPLPVLEEQVRIETPFEYRYLFNYCTYGYSMPWWGWERWEQMIDYMAFMGVNMPLAMIGQEAVWQEVYREPGMTNAQLENPQKVPALLRAITRTSKRIEPITSSQPENHDDQAN